MKNKVIGWLSVGLIILQGLLVLLSWIIAAAVPDSFMHSLLSSEGIRWFFGRFTDNLSSPLFVWLVLAGMAYGVVVDSGMPLAFRRGGRKELKLRFARQIVIAEAITLVGIMLLLTLMPHAVLLSATGSLYPSSFSRALIPYIAISLVIMAISFGIVTGRYKNLQAPMNGFARGMAAAAPFLLLYILTAQLYYSFTYFCT